MDPTDRRPPGHNETGIYLRRLSNGLRVTYKYTDNEVDSAYIRLSLLGGRAAEPDEEGPAGYGCLRTGTQARCEGGTPRVEDVWMTRTSRVADCTSFGGSRDMGLRAACKHMTVSLERVGAPVCSEAADTCPTE